MTNLGVYVQVPFCASKCSFCNFSSGVDRDSVFDPYTQALRRELAQWPRSAREYGITPETFDAPVDTVYIGGGTPTLLGRERLKTVVDALRARLPWAEEVEFTLETTPGAASLDLLGVLTELGVNRLSVGAQTFNDAELRAVGRLHSGEETCQLVGAARAAGFRNISVDLIAGLPHQTEASFRRSLAATVSLRPEHVSLYLFEVDEKSRLGREVVHGGNRYHAATVPSDDFMADAYELACGFLAGEGYVQYEISNFGLPGCESRHNRKYWQLAPYVGFGAGAHSFDGTRRWSNCMGVTTYLDQLNSGQSPIAECRTLTVEEQVEEFFFLGLRQAQGVDVCVARQRWGAAAVDPWAAKIQELVSAGWLARQDDYLRLARHAYLVSNEIFQEFVCV